MSGKSVKVVILGDSSIGKTSLIQRYISGKNDIQNSTLGATFVQLHHAFTNSEEKFIEFPIQFWDTAGQERYHALIPMYVRDADLIIIAFDLNNPISFMNLKTWIELTTTCIRKCKFVLVGCKNDLTPIVETKKKDINDFIEKYIPESKFFSTSSYSGNNIQELFKHIKIELEETGERRHNLNGIKSGNIRLNEEIPKSNIYRDLTGPLNKCCY